MDFFFSTGFIFCRFSLSPNKARPGFPKYKTVNQIYLLINAAVILCSYFFFYLQGTQWKKTHHGLPVTYILKLRLTLRVLLSDVFESLFISIFLVFLFLLFLFIFECLCVIYQHCFLNCIESIGLCLLVLTARQHIRVGNKFFKRG